MKGDGSIFRRGSVWWADYRRGPERIRESLDTDDEKAALDKLKEIRKGLIRGTLLTPTERRVTVGDLLDDLATHLEVRGAASLSKARSHMRALRPQLGHVSAHELATATVERFQRDRLASGRKPATVNRECELLRQAFRLASRRTPPRVLKVPHVPLLKVENARQGFLARADFEALVKHVEDVDVRDFIEWFWRTGMRPKEIRQLTWEMVDKEARTLNLDPKAAKTRRGRVLALEGSLAEIMKRRERRRVLSSALIFHRTLKGKAGLPVKDFRRTWKNALRDAHLPSGLLPYDLRRSALRNMVRGGTDYTVAMKISGHRTRSTFDRYNITDAEDVRAAIIRTDAFVESLPRKRKVASLTPTAPILKESTKDTVGSQPRILKPRK